jgi:hypothetical protein
MPTPYHTIPDDVANRIESVLAAQTSKMQQLIDALRRSIPSYVDERNFAVNSSTLTMNPQTTNLTLITALIVGASSNATLTLGNRTYFFGPTTTVWSSIGILVRFENEITLTQETPGFLSLELMGIELPDKGPF